MCGIFCALLAKDTDFISKFERCFKRNLLARGPNSFKTQSLAANHCDILFAASVLWLQGRQITPQPLESEKSVFVYNGDIFGGAISANRSTTGDTLLFFDVLNSSDDFVDFLQELQGPFAFIFFDKLKETLFFARDHYGRRSLLLAKQKNEVIICSVAAKGTGFDFIELPSIGVFSICLKSGAWRLFPWKRANYRHNLEKLTDFLQVDIIAENSFPPQVKSEKSCDLGLFKHISTQTNVFEYLLNDKKWFENVLNLKHLLENSIKQRITAQPPFCQNCYAKTTCPHATIGVLFSGGIDCAILALIAGKFQTTKPIDLINVAFDARCRDYQTPDRITGLETLNELKSIQPNFNFVPINVTSQELNEERTKRISHLIYPLNTVLDDSLGCALWFAARGLSAPNLKSATRILLVGMGADELFGGYSRHRAALKKGWEQLELVLDEDWNNLPHRNLARDDRVVSDHGKQLRTPYLDENVVEFVRQLPWWEKTYPTSELPQGIGEKILLRSLGYHLGLKSAAKLKKRALQFGSRIANPKENAHEKSERL